jgi:hypothetical protein
VTGCGRARWPRPSGCRISHAQPGVTSCSGCRAAAASHALPCSRGRVSPRAINDRERAGRRRASGPRTGGGGPACGGSYGSGHQRVHGNQPPRRRRHASAHIRPVPARCPDLVAAGGQGAGRGAPDDHHIRVDQAGAYQRAQVASGPELDIHVVARPGLADAKLAIVLGADGRVISSCLNGFLGRARLSQFPAIRSSCPVRGAAC